MPDILDREIEKPENSPRLKAWLRRVRDTPRRGDGYEVDDAFQDLHDAKRLVSILDLRAHSLRAQAFNANPPPEASDED